MTEQNKVILEYLENKLLEIQDTIKKTNQDYPCDEKDSFCYECGNHTHDPSYNEQMQEYFLKSEIEKIKGNNA